MCFTPRRFSLLFFLPRHVEAKQPKERRRRGKSGLSSRKLLHTAKAWHNPQVSVKTKPSLVFHLSPAITDRALPPAFGWIKHSYQICFIFRFSAEGTCYVHKDLYQFLSLPLKNKYPKHKQKQRNEEE